MVVKNHGDRKSPKWGYSPFQMAILWLVNGGVTIYLQVLAESSKHTHTQSFTVFLEEEEVEKLHRAEVLKGFVYVFKGAKFKDLWWSGE